MLLRNPPSYRISDAAKQGGLARKRPGPTVPRVGPLELSLSPNLNTEAMIMKNWILLGAFLLFGGVMQAGEASCYQCSEVGEPWSGFACDGSAEFGYEDCEGGLEGNTWDCQVLGRECAQQTMVSNTTIKLADGVVIEASLIEGDARAIRSCDGGTRAVFYTEKGERDRRASAAQITL